EAKFIVACDGAGSRTRKAAKIDMIGPETISKHVNYYYHADLSHLPHGKYVTGYLVDPRQPGVPGGAILTANGTDRWLTIFTVGTAQSPVQWFGAGGAQHADEVMSEERLQDVIRGLAGIADLKVSL